MFQPIDRIDLYGDGVGYVELWPSWYANQSEETRVEVVSKIATLSYGNDVAKNPQQLYETLKKSKHSSVFEFVVESKTSANPFVDSVYNNLRIDCDMDYRGQRDNTDQSFALYKIKVPIFVFRQIVRHRNFSVLEMSRRYVKDTKRPFEYYKYDEDKEFYDMCTTKYQDAIIKSVLAQEARKFIPVGAYTELWLMNNWSPILGLKNFFDLRLDAQHTQPETVEVARAMSNLIEKHQPDLFKCVNNGVEK